jgi:hypothetical protein
MYVQVFLSHLTRGEHIHLLVKPILVEGYSNSITVLSLNVLYLLSQVDGLQRHLIAILNNYQDSAKMMNGIVSLLSTPPLEDTVDEDQDPLFSEPELYVVLCYSILYSQVPTRGSNETFDRLLETART